MLCSPADLGWDTAANKELAIVPGGLSPGDACPAERPMVRAWAAVVYCRKQAVRELNPAHFTCFMLATRPPMPMEAGRPRRSW